MKLPKITIARFSPAANRRLFAQGYRPLYWVIWEYITKHRHSYEYFRSKDKPDLWAHCKCMNYTMKIK